MCTGVNGGQSRILNILLYQSLPYSLSTASLTEPGARLVTSKPWSLSPTAPGSAFGVSIRDLNSNPHACIASVLTHQAISLHFANELLNRSLKTRAESQGAVDCDAAPHAP